MANPKLLAGRRPAVIVLQILAVTWAPLQDLFGTEDLTPAQIGLCVAVASSVVVLEELRKVGARLVSRVSS